MLVRVLILLFTLISMASMIFNDLSLKTHFLGGRSGVISIQSTGAFFDHARGRSRPQTLAFFFSMSSIFIFDHSRKTVSVFKTVLFGPKLALKPCSVDVA